jgi:LysM repeat protein
MAQDFNFDGSFEDDENQAEAAVEEVEVVERPNMLRRILLLLVVLILLCVVCYLAVQLLGINIPGISPAPPAAPPPVETTEQPGVEPTDPGQGGEVPPGEATDEAPVGGEPGATDEAPGDGTQPTDEAPGEGEPGATDEAPGDGTQPTDEAPGGGEPGATEEPQPEATQEPGPGDEDTISEHDEDMTDEEMGETEPTAEPAPTQETVVDCDNNAAPTAEISLDPNPAMMGKGEAFVTLDGSGSSDADGQVTEYGWDFGDGSDPEIGSAAETTHGYKAEGSYIVTLTVMDACGATDTTTSEVTVVGPTPPASNGDADEDSDESSEGNSNEEQGSSNATATPTPASTSGAPANASLGHCYQVRWGDTLSGIAWVNGLTVNNLARVNNVTTEYYVRAGQGLFIPTGEIKAGPNAYQVQAGDTLNSVAAQCGLTAAYLAQVNQLGLDATLSAGQVLIIPIGAR